MELLNFKKIITKNMNITFYNNFHNGDLHASREFVKDIIRKTNYDGYLYSSPSNLYQFKDIPELQPSYITGKNEEIHYVENNDYFINTWYNPYYGHKLYGCTLEALYYNFEFVYKVLNIVIEPIEFYIPKINYEVFDITNVNKFFKETPFKDKVYISNQDCHSGQSDNIPMTEQIYNLARIFKSVLFITTQYLGFQLPNTITSQEIIQSCGSDLPENSYVSTFCNIIVGRESGPYFLSYVQDNIISEQQQYIIPICHIKPFINEKYYNKNKYLLQLETSKEMELLIAGILIKKII